MRKTVLFFLENKGEELEMKLGIGVQTPDFISPYFSINAAKA